MIKKLRIRITAVIMAGLTLLIAAVVIGGASLSGGSGTIGGAIIGAAIMGVLRNALVLLDVSAYWQQTVIGIVIILAVTLDNLRHIGRKGKR